jgi:hypothetical protein
MTKRRLFTSISIGLLALALTGCPNRKSISEINGDPGRFYDKEVTVVGRVTRNSWGGLGAGVYEVEDGTGKIWIFTERHGAPSKDGYVGVTGKVVSGFVFGGRNYGTIIRETKRRTRPNR